MPNYLSNLRAPEGARKDKRRLGRGTGSGLGKTAGKGQKGQKARHAGNFGKLGYQGGQTPIHRRLPKRGFRNIFAIETAAVNVRLVASKFAAGTTVTMEGLKDAGIIPLGATRVKILGDGEIQHAITVKVHAISARARAKVEKAGGKIELLETEAAPEEKKA